MKEVELTETNKVIVDLFPEIVGIMIFRMTMGYIAPVLLGLLQYINDTYFPEYQPILWFRFGEWEKELKKPVILMDESGIDQYFKREG